MKTKTEYHNKPNFKSNEKKQTYIFCSRTKSSPFDHPAEHHNILHHILMWVNYTEMKCLCFLTTSLHFNVTDRRTERILARFICINKHNLPMWPCGDQSQSITDKRTFPMVAKRRLSEENLTRVTGFAGRHCQIQTHSEDTLALVLSCSSK